LTESKQGQSQARNRAIDAAQGDVIVWTDDDVQPHPDWLANYADAFVRYPDASFFGGQINPWYETPPPKWIVSNERDLQGMLVIRDLGPVERPFEASLEKYVVSETPFGANMAVRTSVQRKHRYDPQLGKVKNSNVTWDETDMFRRVREDGGFGIWVPSASIKHFVSTSRMTSHYLWSYHHGQGRSEVKIDAFELPWNTPVFRHAPRWVFKKKYRAMAMAWWQWITGDPRWAVSYARCAKYAGMIDEFQSTGWQPPPKPVSTVIESRISSPQQVTS
jgi:glycosyltransferase involved in cell wall biosynthesis